MRSIKNKSRKGDIDTSKMQGTRHEGHVRHEKTEDAKARRAQGT